MYNDARAYDLSFVSPSGRPPAKPQIVFTFDERHFAVLLERLQTLAGKTAEEKYLYSPSEFALPFSNLFGHNDFGYGKCGLLQRSGESMSLCVELSQAKLHEAVLTINLITLAFLVPFEEGKKHSNRTQQIDLETCCVRNRANGYGHAIGGYVSSELLLWLCKQGVSLSDGSQYAPIPEEVTTAMQEAYRAVTSTRMERWAKDCGGRINKDGRFILYCSGDACDVAIYPESFYPKDGYGARFSCHNLDSALQQVTLIAGLAKLCEMARKDNE